MDNPEYKGSLRNKNYYRRLWDGVIAPELDMYERHEGLVCALGRIETKRRIWRAYKAFNKHAHDTYMEDPNYPLDRHKVAACYTYAVCAAYPFGSKVAYSRIPYANEWLAITVGTSVLAGFIEKAMQEINLSEEKAEILQSRLTSGWTCDWDVGHGESYRDCVAQCLSFTGKERNYNVMLLALLLYHWEAEVTGPEIHKQLVTYYRKINKKKSGNTSAEHRE